MSKAKIIKVTRDKTKAKRKLQQCSVIKLKIDKSHLSKKQKQQLNQLFLEAKWFYNSTLDFNKLSQANDKAKQVIIKTKDKFETRNLDILGSQVKQSILDKILDNIKGLATKKKKGQKVGKLKFKSQINSIPLKQYKTTYQIKKNRIKIQNIKKSLKVIGLKQIDKSWDIANAKLIKKEKDYYFHITVYKPKETTPKNNQYLGMDFGVKDSITFTNGVKIDTTVKLTPKVKKEHKTLSQKEHNSKNFFKQKIKVKKAYEKVVNQRKDTRDKLVSYLKKNFQYIAVQDENIKGWHSGFYGRQVQQSTIGGIIAGIKNLPQTRIVDRWYPSTQECPKCHKLNKLDLNDRIYKCSCGYIMDRDIHSSWNILCKGYNLPMERRFKPVENDASVVMFNWIKDNCKHCFVKQEAQVL
jgi:putative transposase